MCVARACVCVCVCFVFFCVCVCVFVCVCVCFVCVCARLRVSVRSYEVDYTRRLHGSIESAASKLLHPDAVPGPLACFMGSPDDLMQEARAVAHAVPL